MNTLFTLIIALVNHLLIFYLCFDLGQIKIVTFSFNSGIYLHLILYGISFFYCFLIRIIALKYFKITNRYILSLAILTSLSLFSLYFGSVFYSTSFILNAIFLNSLILSLLSVLIYFISYRLLTFMKERVKYDSFIILLPLVLFGDIYNAKTYWLFFLTTFIYSMNYMVSNNKILNKDIADKVKK